MLQEPRAAPAELPGQCTFPFLRRTTAVRSTAWSTPHAPLRIPDFPYLQIINYAGAMPPPIIYSAPNLAPTLLARAAASKQSPERVGVEIAALAGSHALIVSQDGPGGGSALSGCRNSGLCCNP